MIPSWIIEKQKQEREQEKDARRQLHAPSPEPPTREEIKPESPKDNRGTTEIDFTL